MRLYRPTPNLFDGRVQAGLFDSLPLGDVLPACAAPAAQTALLDPPQGDGDNPTVAEYMAHGVSAEDAAGMVAAHAAADGARYEMLRLGWKVKKNNARSEKEEARWYAAGRT
jgi:hypothetical protein